ncbi:MAG: hypothetical protein H7257_07325, partial [Taibaiella sp.]|nr:hypothetical protein [Taibaiella sp.]
MGLLNRLRIIVLGVMVFGSFASFAHNEWGNVIIAICQGLLAVSCFYEAVFYFRQRLVLPGRKRINAIELSVTGFVSSGITLALFSSSGFSDLVHGLSVFALFAIALL